MVNIAGNFENALTKLCNKLTSGGHCKDLEFSVRKSEVSFRLTKKASSFSVEYQVGADQSWQEVTNASAKAPFASKTKEIYDKV